MTNRLAARILAMVGMTFCHCALADYIISTTPSPPLANQPFKVGVRGPWNWISTAPTVTVNGSSVTLNIAGDCGFLCPAASIVTKTFDMPALAAGDYSLTVNAADRGWLALTVGKPAIQDIADYTDQWFNPAESGWGLGVQQQDSVIFATLFVYGSDGNTTWFVAPDVEHIAGSTGADSFSGTLYKTTGPAFTAGQFNPGSVGVTTVGTLTFNALADGTASVQYSVNSAAVTKSIVRQSWRAVTGTATYDGGVNVTASSMSCSPAPPYSLNSTGSFTVSVGAGTLDIGVGLFGVCRYSGTYTQAGRVGASTGTSTCWFIPQAAQPPSTPVSPLMMALSNIRITAHEFSAHVSGTNGGCTYSGDIGGVRQQ